MIPVLIPLLALLTQQPAQRPHQRPAPTPPQGGQAEIARAPTLRTPYDTTRQSIIELGTRVADVRSLLELYRRAAFNDPDGAVLESAGRLSRGCRMLADSVDVARRKICRHCLSPSAQSAVEDYRAYLPTLAGVARQCSTRLHQLATGDSSAARLRREALPVSNRLVTGVRPYEARLQQVRIAFGWAAPARTPARP